MQTVRPVQFPMAQVSSVPSIPMQAPARLWVQAKPRQQGLQVELQQGQHLQQGTVTQHVVARTAEDSRIAMQLQEQMRAHLWAQVQVGVAIPGFQPQAVEGLLTTVSSLPYSTPATMTHQASYQGLPSRTVETNLAPSPATVSTARLAGNDSCATLPPKAEKVELAAGCMVYIDTCRFKIVSPLGVGSYGMVWSAAADDGLEVAVKEILCRSQAELNNAHFEGGLLDRLGQMKLGGRTSGNSLRMPALVVQETEFVESLQSWRVRLAMSRIPGTPLMILLEQKRMERGIQEKKMREKPESTQSSASPSGVLRPLSDACRLTRALVVQLFPTLESISLVYYHRDINPRNILVDGIEGLDVSYGLVDFGMAVDAQKWRDDSSAGTWQTLEVGGDCRYWPVSAWVMFLHGPQEVQPGLPWRLEYQTQLDIHALGITALQVLVDLSPVLPQADDASDGCLREIAENATDEGETTLLIAKMRLLQDAWAKYWEDSTDFWNCLIECFTTGGDWNALKIACVNHGVQDIVTRDLRALRTALSDAADAASACNSLSGLASRDGSGEVEVDMSAQDLQGLLRAMYLMISTGESDQFPTWDVVRDLLGVTAESEVDATIQNQPSEPPRSASMTPRRPGEYELRSARKDVASALIVENANGNLARSTTRHSAPYGGCSTIVPSILNVTPRRGSSVVVDAGAMDSVVVRSARDASKRAGAAPPSSWKGPPNQTVAGGVAVGVNGAVGATRVITREASAAGNLKAPPMSPMLVRRGVSTQSDAYPMASADPPSRMVSAAVSAAGATAGAPVDGRQVTLVARHPTSTRQPSVGPSGSTMVVPAAKIREPSVGGRSTTNLGGAHTPMPPPQYNTKPPQSPMVRHRVVGSSVMEEAMPTVRSPSVVRASAMTPTDVAHRMRGSSVIVEAAPRAGVPAGINTRGSSVVVEDTAPFMYPAIGSRGTSVLVEAPVTAPPSGRGRQREARVIEPGGSGGTGSVVMPNMYAGGADPPGTGSTQMAGEAADPSKLALHMLSATPAGAAPNHAMGVVRTPVVTSRNANAYAMNNQPVSNAALRRPSPAEFSSNHASLVVPIPPRDPRLPAVNVPPGVMPGQNPFKMQL